ncbi:MAG: lamin tail domain-containing protein [Candidatus Gastranaerophilaceae bacterium]|nr:lamin tail domain-containing protein [Christensenellales bacterium]
MKIGKFLISIVLVAAFVFMVVWVIGNSGSGGVSNYSISINEVMTSNKGLVPDPEGKFYDWVELYNGSKESADISGWGLSDDALSGVKYVFPQGTVIEANGYLVVFCCGETRDGLYAPFKLSSTDDLVLMDTTGRIIESLALRATSSGSSLGKDAANGLWVEFGSPTPGFPNTDEGVQAFKDYLESKGADKSIEGLYINEFMASNASTIADYNGNYSDWIELFNSTDKEIDLSGFYVSDDLGNRMKAQLPDGTVIQAGGYLLIFCSGEEGRMENGEVHVPFGLRAYEEDVALSDQGGSLIDSYSYSKQDTDVSMARIPDGTGEFSASRQPTPGMQNSESSYALLQSANSAATGDLYISEMMGANYSVKVSDRSDYPDWVELHNRGAEGISLLGYSLTDSAKNPAKWTFPDVTIPPGGYLAIPCTGEDVEGLEANFKLSAAGEAVFLYAPDGKLVDKLSAARFRADQSIGRDGGGSYGVFKTPTPGSANTGFSSGYAQKPEITVQTGAYSGSQQVSIRVPEGCTVYYTLDGSVPNQSDAQYTGPIAIQRTCTLRAVSYANGMLESDAATATYLIDSPHTIPVIAIATEQSDFDNIYENYSQEIEIPAHFDLIDGSGAYEYGDDGVVRIFGAYSRQKEQKGLALIARAGYGSSRFYHKFFDSRDFGDYKSLILRASGQESTISRIRDVTITSLLDEHTDLAVQAYRQCVVYVNGNYRGVYNLREKVTVHYLAQHYGIQDPDSIDLLVGNGNKAGYVLNGSNEDYLDLLEYVKTHDMSNRENYEYVCEQVDVDNFAEYTAMQIYVANSDTGNIKFWRAPGRKWQWIAYDFCWAMNASINGMRGYQLDAVAKYLNPAGHGVGKGFSTTLILGLLKNPEFKELFLQKCAKMADVVFSPENLKSRVAEMSGNIREEMKRDTQLWSEMSFEGWERSVNRINEFADARKPYFVFHLKQYFGLSSERCVELFGIPGSAPATQG